MDLTDLLADYELCSKSPARNAEPLHVERVSTSVEYVGLQQFDYKQWMVVLRSWVPDPCFAVVDNKMLSQTRALPYQCALICVKQPLSKTQAIKLRQLVLRETHLYDYILAHTSTALTKRYQAGEKPSLQTMVVCAIELLKLGEP